MISDLNVALKLNIEHNVSDFFVSRDVFLKTLAIPAQTGREKFVVLNRPYSGPSFRFINKSVRNGMEFVYLSNDILASDSVSTLGAD